MKRARTLFLAVVPLLVGSGCNLFEPKIVTACETVIKERLRSPVGYKRVEILRSEAVMNKADYYNYLYATEASSAVRESRNERFEKGEVKPTMYTVYVTYDAPNAFNAPIRGTSVCEYFSERGSDADVADFSVKVDGKTQIEYLTDQIKAAQ
ncbi:hypothetical protein [Rhizobium leguminosarum]|uniref:hypothetical protein n=1 Tax=Rhizobium leguminosarum TaxID=384 RepID=UPI00143F7A5B|nr:hypothetical protein [Rhizobium leguminosarum]NKL24850.1 hypothetical protein [Rhizobium leguminosarum bv. viciae]